MTTSSRVVGDASLTHGYNATNNPLHTEPRAARFGEIKVVRRGPVNGGVRPLKIMNPNDVCQLVESLCEGNDNAFHTLIEAEKTIIPLLTQQFTTHACGADRARIIEVIWQHRDNATIPFLASVLNDEYPEVWKQALDGLVTIGGTDSVEALQLFRGQLKDDDARLPWIAEAIEQMESQIP